MKLRVRWSLTSLCLLLAVGLLSACAQQAPAPTAKPVATPASAATTGAPAAAAPTAAPAAPAATAVPARATAVATAAPAVTTPAAAKPERRGKLVVAHSTDFGTNDPLVQPSEGESFYLSAVFETLMQYDFQGKLVPSLALSYKWLDDKTLEYKLRRGVKFHSGEPFTAADVKFTLEKVMSPYAAKSGKDAYVKQVERLEVIDDFTVRFVLKQKYPVFPYAISNIDAPGAFLIQPKAYIEKNGNEYYSQHPVGTGPFKFKSRVLGSTMDLEAFEDWWGPEAWDLAPTAKEVQFRFIREAQTRVAALLAGEVDVIDGVDLRSVDTVQSKTGYRALIVPGLMVNSIKINSAIEKIPDTDKASPFRDKMVRQAMRYAIDTAAIAKSVLRDTSFRTEGLWAPPGLGAHPERLKTTYPYNPDKARQLLKEANYPSDLETTHYIYQASGRPGFVEANEAADGYLRAVGMNVKTRVVDYGVIQDLARNQKLWVMQAAPMMYPFLDPIRTSGLTTLKGLAPSYSIEADTKIDELVAATQAVTDEKERDERWFDVYNYVQENASRIPLAVQPISFGLSPRVDYKLIPANEPVFPHRITWRAGYP